MCRISEIQCLITSFEAWMVVGLLTKTFDLKKKIEKRQGRQIKKNWLSCLTVKAQQRRVALWLFVSRTTYRSEFTLSIITKGRNCRTLIKPAIAGSSLWYTLVFYEANFCPRLLILSRGLQHWHWHSWSVWACNSC